MRQDIIKQIHILLLKKGKSVAVAESCTAGLTSELLTNLSGSSKYFILGLVTYSNQAKTKLLKIPAKLISQKGAVSKEIAQRMSESVKNLAKADFGIGITGIAGPTGATAEKPVGMVFIAISGKNQKICRKFIFKGNRIQIRYKSALKALKLLKSLLDY